MWNENELYPSGPNRIFESTFGMEHEDEDFGMKVSAETFDYPNVTQLFTLWVNGVSHAYDVRNAADN